MGKKIQNITGTFDVLPMVSSTDAAHDDTIWHWKFVESRIHEIMALYDFKEIRTPVLEPTELIARGIGQLTDIVSKEMFAFERDDTGYVLRPEVTAPVMRAYMQHHLAQQGGTQKLYYIGPCFRAEKPQKGRYRQFHQFGCEVIGADSVFADVETIQVMMHIYDSFGLKNMTLRINSLGDEESRPRYKEALRAYFKPYENELTETSKTRLEKNPLRILDTKNEKEKKILEGAPSLADFIDAESRSQYEQLKQLLSDLNIRFVEDPFLVRGLDYYTRTAFELESGDLGAQSALAGGGRYDLLAMEIGSKTPVPAVGFAAGMERLFIALHEGDNQFPEDPSPDVYLVGLGEEAHRWALLTAKTLRDAGNKVSFDLKGRSLKAQMREANRAKVPFVVIVGENELLNRAAVVKDMTESSQEEVAFEDLVSYFNRSVTA